MMEKRLISLDVFDLTNKHDRVIARRLGFSVPYERKGPAPKDIEARLDKSGECWLWPGAKNAYGYGVVHRRGKKLILVHRYMWEKANGRSADGFVILHSCDTPLCANPAHLRAGSHQENRKECVDRGRVAKGERVATSKLTARDVMEIRVKAGLYGATYRRLAGEYGVAVDTIFKAVARKYWRHIA